LGPVRSLDPDYMGVGAAALNATNTDNVDLNGTTNNAALSLCGLSIVRETQLSSTSWEYVLTTELSNTGTAVGGVSARLTQLPVSGVQWVDDTLVFGAVGSGETAKTADTLTLRSGSRISATTLRYGLGSMKWVVTVVP
jgi:hypothetical protein